MPLHRSLLWLHRWTGLAMAAFLVAAGLSGSVLVFQHQLDGWLNPELFWTTTRGAALAPSTLKERVEASDPRIRVTTLPLRVAPGEAALFSVSPWRNPGTGRLYDVDYDQVFVDPANGQILGTRETDDALIPQIYSFHYTLLAPRGWGKLTLGLVAILWLVNCVIGLYLTLPRGRPFLVRWKPAWLVRHDIGFYRLNFDLHRATGLWSWTVLLVLAVSSVYLNLNFEVFRPLVSLFSPLTPNIYEPDVHEPRRQWVARHPDRTFLSIERAREIARAEAIRRGAPDAEPSHLTYFSEYGVYRVLFRPSQFDRGSGLSRPILYLDDSDGRIFNAVVWGEGSRGDAFIQLQLPLHSGRIAGWPGRIVVFLAGIAVTALSITGVVVWWKKRRLRVPARNAGG